MTQTEEVLEKVKGLMVDVDGVEMEVREHDFYVVNHRSSSGLKS